MSDDVNKGNVILGVSHDSGAHFKITPLAHGSEPWVVATGSNLYAAWETKGTGSVVWFLSSPDNGNTLTTKIISTGILDAWNPMIDAVGNSVWVGIEAFGSHPQNWMLTSINGGKNFSSTSLTGLGFVDGFVFSLPTTDGTNVFAMWLQEQSSTTWNVMVAYSSNGGTTWSAAAIIGQADPNNDVAIGSMASNGAHGFAAWQQNSAIWFASS